MLQSFSQAQCNDDDDGVPFSRLFLFFISIVVDIYMTSNGHRHLHELKTYHRPPANPLCHALIYASIKKVFFSSQLFLGVVKQGPCTY